MQQRTYRALIVDDEVPVREAVAAAMTTRSFLCDTAGDGHEALQKCRDQRYDLVVADLRMPRMHGYALTLELMKDAQPPRIVVLTGVSEPILVKDLFSRGVDDVVCKPIDVRVFATKMAALFERRVWREAMSAASPECYAGAGHLQIARIEGALELASAAIPSALDELFAIAARDLPDPPQAMLNFLERLFDDHDAQGERRRAARVSLLATVAAIPVDDRLQPCGEAFKGAARDISQGGLSLLHTRAVSASSIALRWQSLSTQQSYVNVLMKTVRCRPLGPFYELAGQFVMRD